jgi:acylphosphatase
MPVSVMSVESSRFSHLTRRTVHYAGSVQGVGFRFTVRQIAAELDVFGFVKNLPDGRVQLVVEGRPDAVKQLLSNISDQMNGYISETHELIEPAMGEFSGFEIRR